MAAGGSCDCTDIVLGGGSILALDRYAVCQAREIGGGADFEDGGWRGSVGTVGFDLVAFVHSVWVVTLS
jgi:hypothetical protein